MFRKSQGAMLALLVACMPLLAHAQDGAVDRLRIHGSNTLGAKLVPALVESWLRSIGYVHVQRHQVSAQRLDIAAVRDGVPLLVEIEGRGSAAGMRDLIDGNAELAMLARAPSAQERDDGWQLGNLDSADQAFVIALDGIVAVVRNDSPVRAVRIDQLRGVLSGRTQDWREVGGPSLAIHAHVPARDSGSRELLEQRVLAGVAPDAHVAVDPTARATFAAIAGDPGAIGIVSLRDPLPAGMRTLAIADGGDPVAPTRLQVLSEDYPLMRRLTLYGGQMMTALGRSFALYATTAAGQQAVADAGHIALTLRPVAQQPVTSGWRPYAELVADAERVPLSLRFNYQNPYSLFDSRSERDLERLAAFMRLPRNRARSATVVAFAAPAPGTSALMATIASNDRADIVAAQLQRLGVRVGRARGLGAARPLAGASAMDARFRNERVEVWLR
jgi:phosphate transport system substrate-binding protein